MSSLTPEVIQQLNAFLRQFEYLRECYPRTDRTALKYAALALLNIPGDTTDMQELFHQLAETIKHEGSFLSPFNTSRRFLLASTLLKACGEPRGKLQELRELEGCLCEAGFKQIYYTTIAALIILISLKKSMERDARVLKTVSLFKGMKNDHLFFSNYGNYPLAAILSNRPQSEEEILSRGEYIYDKLVDCLFRREKALQRASYILSLSHLDVDSIVERFSSTHAAFKANRLPSSLEMYDEMAMLSLLSGEVIPLVEILREISTNICSRKYFRWDKKKVLLLAIGILIGSRFREEAELCHLLTAEIHLSLEKSLQTQSMALIATAAASY